MKKNVLVVEDDPSLRMVMREVLQQDFEIDEADNGADGIRKGTSRRADLVILDYHLPKKDGLEVIAALREAHPDLPVIVLTGYLNPEAETRFSQLGASKIFPKPFNYKTLLEAIRALVEDAPESPENVAAAKAAPPPALIGLPPPAKAGAESEGLLLEGLETIARLAEKIEYLQSVAEKPWIGPADAAALRETARLMEGELRRFYGRMNHAVFHNPGHVAPLLTDAPKPGRSECN